MQGQVLDRLCYRVSSLDSDGQCGEMVLHKAITAARVGNINTLKELLTTGDLSAAIVDSQGAGPVHHAARCGQLHCLCFLVAEAGLLANRKALNGAMPVHDAAATGHIRELQWLVQNAGCSVQVSLGFLWSVHDKLEVLISSLKNSALLCSF